MSTLKVDEIVDAAGTGSPSFPNGLPSSVDNLRAVTSTDTLANSDDVVTLSGTFTFSLHALSGATSKPYKLINIGTGTITLDGNSSETIKGTTTRKLMTQYESVVIFPDTANSNWLVLEHHTETEVASYTPTIAGFGIVGSVVGRWWRQGDRMRIMASWSNGTVDANPATITLPISATVDATKLTLNNTAGNPGDAVGQWTHDAGSNEVGTMLTAPATDASKIYMGTAYVGVQKLITQQGNAIMSSTNWVSVEVDVPITDWWA